MSVRPVTFEPNGDITVIYDEQGHSGTIPAAEAQWSLNIDGTPNHNYIILACPDGCGASSTWPVGGGADASNGQRMFVDKATREPCPCGRIDAGNENVADAHMHLQCERMDGPERWVA